MRLRYLRISHTPDAPLQLVLQTAGFLESSRQAREWVRDSQEAISRLRGCTLLSNDGAGKPGFRFVNEKCTSARGVLKGGALGLEGYDLAVA